MKRIDLTGKRFGMLTVIRYIGNGVNYAAKWECLCDCGKLTIAYASNLRKVGHTTSCGCGSSRHTIGSAVKTHGLSKNPLYGVWKAMIDRCYNPKCKQYKHYGGIGIAVCQEWRSDPNEFINWAIENGWERGKEIDKDIIALKKKERPMIYSKEYCSVVTRSENNRYTKSQTVLEYNGVVKNIAEWASDFGVKYTILYKRLFELRWPIEKALTWPYNKKEKYKIKTKYEKSI